MPGNSKVFTGVVWASIQRFGGLAISFISNMVLARLLTPDDFGTIGMLLFFLALSQTFIDSGFGSALIQKKDITQIDKSTVFYINLTISIIVYFLLFIFAPAIAKYYNVPILVPLLRVMGLTVIIQGFGIIQSTQLAKQMDFRKLAIANLSGSIVLALSGITAALLGCGVWSLVIRSIANVVTITTLLWILSKWRPSKIFSWKSLQELFGFGGYMLLSSVMLAVSNNVQALIVGKLFPARTLGNFTQARTLRNIPSEGIASVIGQVLYPDFSSHQDENSILISRLNKSAYYLSFVVVPLMLLCILIAEPLIHFVYGSQWDEAIPYFQILCFGGIPLCLQDININVIKAKGASRVLFICNLIKVVTYIIMMIVGAKMYGIYGFLWAMVAYTFLAYLAFAIIGTRYLNTTIYEQLLSIFRCFLAVLPSFVAVSTVNSVLYAPNFVLIIIDTIIFFTFFLMVAHFTKMEPLPFFIQSFKQSLLLNKQSKK